MPVTTVVRRDGLETKVVWGVVGKGYAQATFDYEGHSIDLRVKSVGTKIWYGYKDGTQTEKCSTKYQAQQLVTEKVHRMRVDVAKRREVPVGIELPNPYSTGRAVTDVFKQLQAVQERKKRILTQFNILERQQFELENKLARMAGVRL